MLSKETYVLLEKDVKQEPESFEKALAELKIVLAQLEGANSDLDYSILLFKRGNFLSKWSSHYLDTMEEEINKLTLHHDSSQEC